MKKNSWPKIVVSAGIFLTTLAAHAEVSSNRKYDATLGGSWEYGQLSGDDAHGHKARSMTAWSFEALPGYRLNPKWLVGLDLNYRIQQQQTGISDAGGTNLKGKGWLLGLGAQYRLNPKWALQGAIDFLGNYTFDKQTAAAQDDHLEQPLSLRLKAQYFFREKWTGDISVNCIRWSKFEVTGSSHDEFASQWMIGAGITYHFGGFGAVSDATESTKPAVPAQTEASVESPKTQMHEKVAAVIETERTSTGLKAKLPSAAFASGKAELSAEYKKKLKEVGAILASQPDQKVRVEGHTDSSGSQSSNLTLSKRRAESVKKVLVESGVSGDRVRTEGFGSKNPIADNKTVEGRAENRRVEIFFDNQ